MASTQPTTLGELFGSKGLRLPPSGWITVTQRQIDLFAEATGDRQWIHLDPERAARDSPWGTTVAHGFLTLSLLSRLWADALVVSDARMGVNYGLNRVRFPAPLKAGDKIRAHFTIQEVEPIADGIQLTLDVVVEVEGSTKPCCVAQWVCRKLG